MCEMFWDIFIILLSIVLKLRLEMIKIVTNSMLFSIGDGLFFENVLVTNGIVILEDIGTSASDAVQCRTSVTDCCTDSNTSNWRFPNGTTLSTLPEQDIYQVKGDGYLYLQRNARGSEGIYCCNLAWPNPFYCLGLYFRSSSRGELLSGRQHRYLFSKCCLLWNAIHL